mgnify:CR=1 FL=1|jgi:hypothetical protein
MKVLIKIGVFVLAIFFAISCKNNTINASISGKSYNASSEAASLQNATSSTRTTLESVSPIQSQNITDATVSSLKTQTTSFTFEKVSYDWGEIKEGDKMTHVFKFKNIGKEDLIISSVRPSCGCTTPEWPKEPIKAGVENEIKVIFDSNHKQGDVLKTIAVTANTEPAITTLTIKGKVNSKLNSLPNE